MPKLAAYIDAKDCPPFPGEIVWKNPRWWNGRAYEKETHFITDDPKIREVYLAAGKIEHKAAYTEKATTEEVASPQDSATESPTPDVDIDSMNAEEAKAYAKDLTGEEYKSKREALEAIKKVL